MNDKARIKLGENLRSAREYRGYLQEDVAKKLGIPRSAISLMESGGRSVEATELQKLAKIYGCTIQDLMGEKENELPSSAQLIARTSAELSEEDRSEVLRFAEYLKTKKSQRKS